MKGRINRLSSVHHDFPARRRDSGQCRLTFRSDSVVDLAMGVITDIKTVFLMTTEGVKSKSTRRYRLRLQGLWRPIASHLSTENACHIIV